jgi:putative phosphoesterase
MIVGILSDSHGDARMVSSAVEVLAGAGAEAFFHCGDIGGEAVLDQLVGRRCWFVWGNLDYPTDELRAYAEAVGLKAVTNGSAVELAGKKIGLWHGHEQGFRKAIRSGALDYIFHGHTHAQSDVREGSTRVINPGALYRARIKTAAALDLLADELRFHVVERRG